MNLEAQIKIFQASAKYSADCVTGKNYVILKTYKGEWNVRQKIQWHPGFIAAMSLEFSAEKDALVFEKEYNLNTKPLEIL